ncbi:MAG: rhombotarget lipoprotein [Gemmatimonadaceae bacterium]
MRAHCRTSALVPLLPLIAFAIAGCASAPQHHATSVVNYLYPQRMDHVETASVPVLALPLRVGVAFVPEDEARCQPCAPRTLAESDRLDLMKQVAAHFRDPKLVKSIEIIPSAYLTPRGSFDNLDQLRSMFGVDVIALISYDQIQFVDQKRSSITYWTVVGAYLVNGEKNDTRTMVDAVVYDIASRRLLFRAPGVSHIKGSAAPVNLDEQLRNDSNRGFHEASTQLITNLDDQLAEFKQKVRESPEEYKVVRRGAAGGGGGGTGAGSIDGWFAALFVGLAAVGALAQLDARRRNAAPRA